MQEYTGHRGKLIHYGALKIYESDSVAQGKLETDSVTYYHHHPHMKEELLTAAKLFREFRQHYHLLPMSLEQVVYSLKHGFAGRVDFQGYLVDNTTGSKTPILMDIKTSNRIYEKSVSKQLSAYNHALNNWADKLYVLLLHPGKTTINGVEVGATKPYWLFQEVPTDFRGFLSRLDLFKRIHSSIFEGERTYS